MFPNLAARRAQDQPDGVAYEFLRDGETAGRRLTYSQLHCRAGALAARLLERGAQNTRVLLLFPPSVDYIVGLYACWYAGLTAVPAYPPSGRRRDTHLLAVSSDADIQYVLTTSKIHSWAKDRFHNKALRQMPDLDGWIVADTELRDDLLASPLVDPDIPALLQYTSGTTGNPKGVVLSHHNLIENSEAIRSAFRLTSEERCLIWLPPYHDMGLIGGILQPMYTGFPVTLLSPMTFLQRPMRWLEEISRLGITVSGAPSFAYALCVGAAVRERRSGLDLRSWRVAFNGAEPVRGDVIDRFAEAFGPYGFRRSSFHPCYGLAEATLLVSGGPLRPHSGERPSSGTVAPGHTVCIVDPKTGMQRGQGESGEIWVEGPSVSQGYWRRPKQTRQFFQNYLEGQRGPFLRTGDLGFLHGRELTVTGRIKDLIIIRGRNYYPEDVEAVASGCHVALRPGRGAAFAIESESQEQLVVVHEIERRAKKIDSHEISAAINGAVSDSFSIRPHAVVLVKAGTIPTTTSGKIQRSLCRRRFLEGRLEPVVADREVSVPREDHSGSSLENDLVSVVVEALRLDPDQIRRDVPLNALGLDSLAAAQLMTAIAVRFGVQVSLSALLDGPSLAQLAESLPSYPPCLRVPEPNRRERANGRENHYPLSFGQRALWFVHQLEPENPAYHLSTAVRIDGELDVTRLRQVVRDIVARHAALRSTFGSVEGRPFQIVHESIEIPFTQEDGSDWSDELLQERLDRESVRPFDLSAEPPVRVLLVQCSARLHVLVVCLHHIAVDFWSMAIVARELSTLYGAGSDGLELAPPPLEYVDYVHWQMEMLESEAGERLWSYWRERLSGELPVVNLPRDHPHPLIRSYRGGSESFTLDRDLTLALKSLASVHGSTAYTLLLAAWQTFLYRYSGQKDILVGSPTAGRAWPGVGSTVGYFVNPVVHRARFEGDPRFEDFLDWSRREVEDALEHQDFPFALLVERLRPARDTKRPPIFQVMFVYESLAGRKGADLASIAVGRPSAAMDFGGLSAEIVMLPNQGVQFELTLVIADDGERFQCRLDYDAELFDCGTIRRMVKHFETLLTGLADDPGLRVSELPLMSSKERDDLQHGIGLVQADRDVEFVHHRFEQQAKDSPGRVALVFEDREVTYAELNLMADSLAQGLRRRGITSETTVAVAIDRSVEMVVALLGIWKAGGAYVPLELDQPTERLFWILQDSSVRYLLTHGPSTVGFEVPGAEILDIDSLYVNDSNNNDPTRCEPGNLAYVMYTSGSTGRPKGVMITHESVANFVSAMDERIRANPGDTLLATTSISFDISVLELFWTLAGGMTVVLLRDEYRHRRANRRSRHKQPFDFSLFYFASEETGGSEKYRLLLEGAKFADQAGFTAVWTPERHFHEFGGLFPNPAVTSAALAAVTRNIHIRAGSVVLPLHHPLRVAEEWSVVDNLSNGRVGVAFASGWHADDFVLFPERYAARKAATFEAIETVKKLWRGEALRMPNGYGNEVEIHIQPRPIQRDLPIWITCAGSIDTFEAAGEMGANVLTHLLGQSPTELAEKVRRYREARERRSHDRAAGRVTLMVHTFVGPDEESVFETVREPFRKYLGSSLDLIAHMARSLDRPLDLERMTDRDRDELLDFACERYFRTSALFGTPNRCQDILQQLHASGIDEIACLIDFGVDTDAVLASLNQLERLRHDYSSRRSEDSYSLARQAARYHPTHLQCTPSLARMLLRDSSAREALRSLRYWMIGGEALSPDLARQVVSSDPTSVENMYGPTETTIWSVTGKVTSPDLVRLGEPISNTTLHILDPHMQPVPDGISGELYIGGHGLARGYIKRPDLTADSFVPDPFNVRPGRRLYRTGDLVRRDSHGIEFLGRRDGQVKIRGHRIEPGEIEYVLRKQPGIVEALVVTRTAPGGSLALVAYVTCSEAEGLDVTRLRFALRRSLPEYMLPQEFVRLDEFPLTPNGKVDRSRLPDSAHPRSTQYAPPQGEMETLLASLWRDSLHAEHVGVQDNFFELGGHSLLMAEIQSRLREEFSIEVALIEMFEHPTISSLASKLVRRSSRVIGPDKAQERALKQKQWLARQRQIDESRGNVVAAEEP